MVCAKTRVPGFSIAKILLVPPKEPESLRTVIFNQSAAVLWGTIRFFLRVLQGATQYYYC